MTWAAILTTHDMSCNSYYWWQELQFLLLVTWAATPFVRAPSLPNCLAPLIRSATCIVLLLLLQCTTTSTASAYVTIKVPPSPQSHWRHTSRQQNTARHGNNHGHIKKITLQGYTTQTVGIAANGVICMYNYNWQGQKCTAMCLTAATHTWWIPW